MAQQWNTCSACTGPGFHSSLSPTKAHSIAEGGRPLHIHLPKVPGEERQKRGCSQPLVFSAVGCLSGYHWLPNGCPCQNLQWLLSQGTPLTWQPRATGWPGTSRCSWMGGVERWSSGCHGYLRGGLRVHVQSVSVSVIYSEGLMSTVMTEAGTRVTET